MALFGLFGKKGNPPAQPGGKEDVRSKRTEGARSSDEKGAQDRSQQVQRNAARATATAKKIDAIESEMSSEFSPSRFASDTVATASQSQAPASIAHKSEASRSKSQPEVLPAFKATLPSMGMSTEFLLGEEGKTGAIELSSSETAQIIEEAAILFANGQSDMAEQLLQDATQDEILNKQERTAWWMLFDLYQIAGKKDEFETLSINYASKFETSPPTWIEGGTTEKPTASSERKGVIPAVPFTGKLDGNIIKLLERAKKLGENSQVLRLEFSRVTEVDPVGCGLLLRILNKLHSSEHDLILVGASELIEKIRSILQVGRRDETEAPWLLMLELLRLLNNEKDFEESSIDYCITFEVSPPAFIAPKNKVTTAIEDPGAADTISDAFLMPNVIEGSTEQLLTAIHLFSAGHNPAILDCSRLHRVDFSAAGQLLSGLAPLCGQSKAIELHNVNHLVNTLFNVMGLKDIALIVPKKL